MTRSKRSNKTTILSVALICVSVLIILASSLAFFTDKRDTTSNVSFGKIEISTDENFKKLSVPVTDVLPGSKLTDAITFSKAVDSESMYVRAKVYFDTTSEVADVKRLVAELNAYDLGVANESEAYQWSDKYGSFYYLMDKTNTENVYEVTNSNTIKLSNGFNIPTNLTQLDNYAQYFETITLNIEIQAVQTDDDASLSSMNETFNSLFGECKLPTSKEYFTFSNGAVTGFSDAGSKAKLTEIVIPSSDNEGNPITSIGESAFEALGLTSVIIPNGVTSIGACVFYECTSLKSIIIPNSVTSIGWAAFSGCSLTSVTYTKEVTGKYSFVNGTLTILDGGMTDDPQWDEDNLNPLILNVVFNGNETSIGSSAFGGCTSLTEITIPDSVTSIGERAFSYCSGLTSITIPESVTSIGANAFNNCYQLPTITEDGLTYIQTTTNNYYYLKNVNKGLTNVSVNEQCRVIGAGAFYNCSSLTSISIPDSVTSIGSYAFDSCSSLTSISIPDSVTSIGSYAFDSCSSLTSVTFKGANGWFVADSSTATSGTNVTLTDTSTNATYLKSTYYNNYWIKKSA